MLSDFFLQNSLDETLHLSAGEVLKRDDGSSTYGTISYYYLDFGTPGLQRVVRYSTEQSGTSNYIWDETYFDGLGRTIKARREGPDGKTIAQQTFYDQRGLKSRESLPYFEGLETLRHTFYTYDAVGRLTQTTAPDGTNVNVSYDKGRTTIIDPSDHKKIEEKDIYGRIVKVEEYSGTSGNYALYASTSYKYDVVGNLLSTTDVLNNQTTITYDTLGRKVSMTDPDMGTWIYTYDANGNLASQKDAKNNTVYFTYDSLSRLTLKDYPSGTDATYTYDETAWSTNAKGRLTTLSDASGALKFYYDVLGNVPRSVKKIDNIEYPIKTTYDALGRTSSITYPDDEVVNYTYDTGGNLTQVGGYAQYSNYNALGQVKTTGYGNGVTTTYQYLSTNNRLYSIATNNATQGLINLSYAYDNIGNVKNITDLLNGSRTQTFTYDDLNRLVQAQSTAYGTLSYSYNQIGNILSKEGMSYTYGSKPHAVASTSDGKTYAYDANGNMTSDAQRTFAYDFDNMPSSITFGGVATTFVYDGAGTRVKKISQSGTTTYIGKLYECVNGSCAKYIFGAGRIALKRGNEVLYYHQDHLGSSRVVTDVSGNKVEETTYLPFGGTSSDTGISVNHKYTSQEYDGETGLYYYGARYYNPAIGRFISPDSIVPDPFEPQTFNRYSYVYNNPLKYTDPNGEFGIIESIIIGAIVGALISGSQNDWDPQEMLNGAFIGGLAGGLIFTGIETIIAAESTAGSTPTMLAANDVTLTTVDVGYIPVQANEVGITLTKVGEVFNGLSISIPEGWEVPVGIAGAGGFAYGFLGDGGNNDGPGGNSGGYGGGTISSGGLIYSPQGHLIGEEGLESNILDEPSMFFVGGGLRNIGKGASIGRSIISSWSKGTFKTRAASIRYHYGKHGNAQGIENYTKEALELLRINKGTAQPFQLKTGEMGIKIKTKTESVNDFETPAVRI